MKKYIIIISVAIAVCVGVFFFFHVPKQSCSTLRDPSGMPSTVCAPTRQSPYQRMYLLLHQYFYPKDSCFISIETGDVDCQSFPAFLTTGYNQSATTTPRSEIEKPAQTIAPSAYQTPNVAQPLSQVTTSSTSTVISLDHFYFSLPPGWHGNKYQKSYSGGYHWLFQREPNEQGFTIDCPPDGKGLEAAVTLSRDQRTFSNDGTAYTITLFKMTAEGNEPWLMAFIDHEAEATRRECLVWGAVTPEIEVAVRELYTTWR